MDAASLLTGILLGSISFALFVYGKKQERWLTMCIGLVLGVVPFLADAVWVQWLLAGAGFALVWWGHPRGL